MCIGAAAAGRKAMTATSGPGLSLMSEHIGLAVMAETPVVIVDCQRMGPSTGGATTVSQGDVQFARWAAPGGFPMVVLCPSTVAECYSLTIKAFNLAERLRTPVILLADKDVCTTLATVDAAALAGEPAEQPRLCTAGSVHSLIAMHLRRQSPPLLPLAARRSCGSRGQAMTSAAT